MIKPGRLKRGDTLAVISPSNGLPCLFPRLYEMGLEHLQRLGFQIVEMPTARMSPDELYKNPALRAKDINDAFADPTIDGILCSIGGYESVRILSYLDTEVILPTPKLLMGFSDSTTFLSYLNTLGLVTFYGPSVMAGFAQLGNLPSSFEENMRHFLFEEFENYEYRPYESYTEGYKDWACEETLGQCTDFYPNEGPEFLLGQGTAEGELWGGCIEVLEFLKSTRFYPPEDFFKGKILFLETSEEKPLPAQVGYMLRNYGIQGVFDRISGILIGRPKDYTREQKLELKETVCGILSTEFGADHLPVVMNCDFGHTDPKHILPLGCRLRIDPKNKRLTLMESPFAR